MKYHTVSRFTIPTQQLINFTIFKSLRVHFHAYLYLVFTIFYILYRNIFKCFTLKMFILHWIVCFTGKLPWMEPLAPSVGAFDKLDTRLQRHRIHGHPDADQAEPVHRVICLVMVPRSFLLSSLDSHQFFSSWIILVLPGSLFRTCS